MLGVFFHFPTNVWATRLVLPHHLFPKQKENSLNELHDQEISLDHAFKHWLSDHTPFLRRLRLWSLLYNHKFMRLLTSGYHGRPKYQATFDRIDLRFTKPTLRIAVANMVFTYLLIIIADVFALKTVVKWGYQFTIFCIESLLFTLIVSCLELIEYCRTRSQEP
jgi:hypothetical protein